MALNNAAKVVAAEALRNALAYIQLHSGDPGSSGINNPASASRQICGWDTTTSTGTFESDIISFSNLTPGSSVTWVSFWSASSGGTWWGNLKLTRNNFTADVNGDFRVRCSFLGPSLPCVVEFSAPLGFSITSGRPLVVITVGAITGITGANLSLTMGTPVITAPVTTAITGTNISLTMGTPIVTSTAHKVVQPTGTSISITTGTLTVTGGTPKLATLVDSFGSVSGLWTMSGGSNGFISGGTMNLISDATFNGYGYSTNRYDFVGSSIIAKVVPAGTGAASTASMFLRPATIFDGNNSINAIVENGFIRLQTHIASVLVDSSQTAYSATNHAWWRLRESAGSAFLDVSSDGVNWTNLTNLTYGALSMSSTQVMFTAYQATGSATTTVDNVNVPPLAPAVVSPTGATLTLTMGTLTVAPVPPFWIGKKARGTYIQDSLLWGGSTSAASYAYLAAAGVNTVRVSFPWENTQPALGGPLAATGRYGIAIITRELDNANAAGIKLWLTPMNQCRYNNISFGAPTGPTTAQFSNFWTRMATAFGSHPALAGWDLMNEPHNVYPDADTGNSNTRAGAITWETYSQAAVTALRNAGDTHWIHCEGYSWSEAPLWQTLHPTAWINDPLRKTVYSCHMYPAYIYLRTGAPNGVDLSYSYWASSAGRTQLGAGASFPAWVLSRMQSFINWLHNNGLTTGDLGETSWPSSWAMIRWNGMSSGTAATESDLWNTNIGNPLMQLLDDNDISVSTQGAGGWASDLEDEELLFFRHNAGGGVTIGGDGIPTTFTIDSTLSNYSGVMPAHLNQ